MSIIETVENLAYKIFVAVFYFVIALAELMRLKLPSLSLFLPPYLYYASSYSQALMATEPYEFYLYADLGDYLAPVLNFEFSYSIRLLSKMSQEICFAIASEAVVLPFASFRLSH